jgi:hypothetical protein
MSSYYHHVLYLLLLLQLRALPDRLYMQTHLSELTLLIHYFRQCFLGAFAKLRKVTVNFAMSVRPSAWNNSAPTGRIFMKLGIR